MFKDLYQVLEYAWSLLFDQRGEAGEGEGEGGQGSGEGEGHAAGGEGEGEGEGQTVPVSVVQSIREEMSQVKDQLQVAQDQIRLYQANAETRQAEGEGAGKKGEVLTDMEDDDVITVADAKKLVAQVEAKVDKVLGEVTLSSQKSDYAEVIQNHLPVVLRANPALIDAISTSKNPHLLAYEIGKQDPEYVKKVAEKGQSEAARKAEENANKPGSASQAGGGGGGLTKADQFEKMSDDDLEKHIESVKKKG